MSYYGVIMTSGDIARATLSSVNVGTILSRSEKYTARDMLSAMTLSSDGMYSTLNAILNCLASSNISMTIAYEALVALPLLS